ncbi:hypothetical protein BT93_L3840 [Corymbia citriodora subsp. variegata]|uniref:DUF7081 domain-containing protein n=1 Tax=Corymbia citriodora subsp. variegata TaxID=360336 RepID=A0A8T0CL24_CORYI|nr:hypothetical protein BT93_L3840 [Corymbia citriodora subsp. variegata]
MEKGKQVMGNEVLGEKAVKMNYVCLYPVKHNSLGEGLPHAPVGWPIPGDTWYWHVINRSYHSVSIKTGSYIFQRVSASRTLIMALGASLCLNTISLCTFQAQMSIDSLLLLAAWFPL